MEYQGIATSNLNQEGTSSAKTAYIKINGRSIRSTLKYKHMYAGRIQIDHKPEILEFVEDSRRLVEDVYLARWCVKPSHGQTVWKGTDEQCSDRVNRRHLVRQHSSLCLVVVNQEYLTCSTRHKSTKTNCHGIS